MSLVDSNAVFESRALSIGISQPVINALATRGWVTHATFAFAVATNPAAGDDQNFIDGVLVPILGDVAPAGGLHGFRWLNPGGAIPVFVPKSKCNKLKKKQPSSLFYWIILDQYPLLVGVEYLRKPYICDPFPASRLWRVCLLNQFVTWWPC